MRDDVDEDENKRNKSDFVLWFTKSKFDMQFVAGSTTSGFLIFNLAQSSKKASV